MAEYDKTRFFWFQLKEDFFDEDAISWLEEQENGKEYCLFYLKLCLKSLKTNGILVRQVGKILVPYSYEQLSRLTKTDIDTVIVAIELLLKIGLVVKLENGEFLLPGVEDLIGSKSIGAFKKQQQLMLKNKGGKNSTLEVENFPPELELNININKNISGARTHAREEPPNELKPPTLEEIREFAKSRNSPVSPQQFFDYYQVAKWRDKKGDSVIDCWKQKLISWEGYEIKPQFVQSTGQNFKSRDYSEDELNSHFQNIDDIEFESEIQGRGG